MSKETLASLHKTYLGGQDKHCDLPPKWNWKHDNIVKETRTVTFNNPAKEIKLSLNPQKTEESLTDVKVENKPIALMLSPARISNEAYTNFRVTPASAVERVALSFGEHRHVEDLRLFKHLGTEPKFYQMSEGRAIPALSRSPNVVKIYTNQTGPVTVSYDVVSSTEDEYKQGITGDLYYGEQFTGTDELCNTTKNKIRLPWNHPIVKIYLFTDVEDVEDARLELDGHDHGLVFTKVDGHYEFNFGHETSVNFSRVDNPFLILTTKTPAKPGSIANVFAIYKQVMYRCNGVAKCGACNC